MPEVFRVSEMEEMVLQFPHPDVAEFHRVVMVLQKDRSAGLFRIADAAGCLLDGRVVLKRFILNTWFF